MILPIDELNRAVPYEKYFGTMKISEKQKRERIEFAKKMEEVIKDIFSLYAVLSDYAAMDDYIIFQQLERAYLDVTESFQIERDDYVEDMAKTFATNFVRTTNEHLTVKPGMQIDTLLGFLIVTGIIGSRVLVDEYRDGKKIGSGTMDYKDVLAETSNGWYLSEDRAKYNAENEANTVLNYKDYKEAAQNYKYKTWITENDIRVRDTHIPLEGETIPISDMFVVGEALMRFPKDIEYAADSPEEIVNCRCSIKYSN